MRKKCGDAREEEGAAALNRDPGRRRGHLNSCKAVCLALKIE